MQPWQQVQVTDPESEFHGRAGVVEFVSIDADGSESITVRLDAREDAEEPVFVDLAASALRLL